MVSFIAAHLNAHGVELICDVLPSAPATYYDYRTRRADPAQLSDRARRDEALRPETRRQLRRKGFDVSLTSGIRHYGIIGLCF